jgi:hypothetical protein
MPEAENPRFVISSSELDELTELFCLFEGGDFKAAKVREAKVLFEQKIERIYRDRVYPRHGDAITSITFFHLVRSQCKQRILKKAPPTP